MFLIQKFFCKILKSVEVGIYAKIFELVLQFNIEFPLNSKIILLQKICIFQIHKMNHIIEWIIQTTNVFYNLMFAFL